MDEFLCEICNGLTEPEWICDRCERRFCEDCSYIFSLHYQHEGNRCYQCADQDRKKPLIPDLRNNSIKYILNVKG